MNRIPIYLNKAEVGPGLPDQCEYHYSGSGHPIGWIGLPEGMVATYCTDYIAFDQKTSAPIGMYHVAAFMPWRSVKAAIAGEHGLTWEPAREPA